MTSRLRTLFAARPPLVGVVHLAPSLSYATFPGRTAALDGLRSDLAALAAGGIDGVLLENDNDKPHTLTVSKAQVAWLTQAACVAREATTLPVGIGVQRIDWEATVAIAAAAGLDFVRLDVFVDRVRMLDQDVAVDPAAVLSLRTALRAESVQLWTDVHVKHAELVGSSPIEASAREAAARGSDAVLVSGTRTGEPPDLGELERARGGAAPVPILIGSGLTAELAPALAPHADGAVVGTSLKEGDRISAAKVARVVEAWQRACASRP